MVRSRWPKGWAAILFPDCRSVHTAFTFLRPDIVFMDKTNKILRVEAQAAPWKAYWGPTGTRHCLEVPRGSARSRGWKPGKTRLVIVGDEEKKPFHHQGTKGTKNNAKRKK